MREWRKTHTLNEAHRARFVCRKTTRQARDRGDLVPQPCAVCAAGRAEMHHIDHERPYDVTWLCRPCHLAWHSFWRSSVLSLFDLWLDAARLERRVNREAA